MRAGLRVVVVDCDPEEGSIGIADLREMVSWPVVSSRVSFSGTERIASLRDSGEYDLVVCDLPGTDSMSLARTLSEMDLVLSPVGVGPADIMAAANFLWAMQGTSLPMVFVLKRHAPGPCASGRVGPGVDGPAGGDMPGAAAPACGARRRAHGWSGCVRNGGEVGCGGTRSTRCGRGCLRSWGSALVLEVR